MSLVHYSTTRVTMVLARHDRQLAGPKPRGLWISDESDYGWSAWCRDEEYGIGGIAHSVTLAADANIMRLATVEDIDHFTAYYATERWLIDWQRVARCYQGILITPYQWERRHTHHTSWYYGWDCASGCIWDPAAIASIEVVTSAAVLS